MLVTVKFQVQVTVNFQVVVTVKFQVLVTVKFQVVVTVKFQVVVTINEAVTLPHDVSDSPLYFCDSAVTHSVNILLLGDSVRINVSTYLTTLILLH